MRRYRALCLAACLLGTLVDGRAQSADTLVVRPHAVDVAFPAEAVVEAIQQATVAAQVAGRVVEVRADAGQVVKKGEVLMRLDVREAGEAAAAAQAQYLNAKASYERTKRLVEQKFMSSAALDKARMDLDAASATVGAASAGQSHGTILAPVSGVVARRHAELGEMAAPGRPLFTVYEPGGLRVTAAVPQARLKDMRSVKLARVEFPELGKWVDSTGVTVLPTVDAATHVSQVRVSLPLLPEATPGMFARVYFVTGQAEKLTVPASAVVRRGEVSAVYVLAGDSRPSLRQVRLGEVVGVGEIEVLAGLSSGEKVAVDAVKAGIVLKQTSK